MPATPGQKLDKQGNIGPIVLRAQADRRQLRIPPWGFADRRIGPARADSRDAPSDDTCTPAEPGLTS